MTVAVLQVIAVLDPAAGGPPASAVATALALKQQGVANEFVFPVQLGRENAVSEFVGTLREHGVPVHIFGEPSFLGARASRWGISPSLMLWLFRHGSQFDVIHVHMGWTYTTVVGLVSAKVCRRASVLSPHESLTDFDRAKSGPLHRRIKQLLRWLYMRSFDVIVVASTLELSDMGSRAGFRSVVVPHAVLGVSAAAGSPSAVDELRVGFLGRLHPKKNVELLIDAVASLPENVSLHVAGDGPPAYRESLASRAAARGVEGRVRWLGFVDRATKSEFFASIDVLAMPSAFECFGVSAAEALIAGLPVVVSSRVGVAEVVERYECGRVVAANAPAISHALRELLTNEEARQELSRNARIAAQEFSVESHGCRLTAEYERALRMRLRRNWSLA